MFVLRLRLRVLLQLFVLMGVGLFGFASMAEAGFWQLVDTSSDGPINGKCVPGEARPQGGQWKIFAAGPTLLEVGTYVEWEPTPYWTDARISLPPLPSRLEPGQNVQWPLGIDTLSAHPKIDISAWVYRQPGIGGGSEQLALFGTNASKHVTSSPHIVPDGPADPDSYLIYATGGGFTGGFTCQFYYRYQWTNSVGPNTLPVPNPLAVPSFERNTDRIGSDYERIVGIKSAGRCNKLCAADMSCLAYTWVRPGIQGAEPVCYLKNPVPPATPSDCCISGRK